MPKIRQYDSCAEFCKEMHIGKGDLIFASAGTYERALKGRIGEGALVVDYRKHGRGEPTDRMAEGIAAEIKGHPYDRVVAIGGGTILDVAKLFALKQVTPVVDLFQKKIESVKEKELVLVPTTCGTGSEVTNISILELTAIHSKFGLAADALYADTAVLIPELLDALPDGVFATSSIDALVHAFESYLSPKANALTRLFSQKAIRIILSGYRRIAEKGEKREGELLHDFLTASACAGIAFGNAGCGAVHAMSYPLGAAYHVAHGEANYALFTQVFKTYQSMEPNGKIRELNAFAADILGCDAADLYPALDALLAHFLPRKALRAYGVKEAELSDFTETVMTKQTRLMNNNYVPLDGGAVLKIYRTVY